MQSFLEDWNNYEALHARPRPAKVLHFHLPKLLQCVFSISMKLSVTVVSGRIYGINRKSAARGWGGVFIISHYASSSQVLPSRAFALASLDLRVDPLMLKGEDTMGTITIALCLCCHNPGTWLAQVP